MAEDRDRDGHTPLICTQE